MFRQGDTGTLNDVPATNGLVAALSVERAIASRATLRPAPTPAVEQAAPGGMLAHLDQRLPAPVPDERPLGSSLAVARLDRGRVALTDARKQFGWTPGTTVEVTASGGGLTVVAVSDDGDEAGLRLDRDGRLLIALARRRLLNITTTDAVLVATCHEPVACVRILPMEAAVQALMTAGVLPGTHEGDPQ